MSARLAFLLVSSFVLLGQTSQVTSQYSDVTAKVSNRGLRELGAYMVLSELTGKVGARLSGSPQAAAAVEWGRKTMLARGFEKVHLEPVRVEHWVRGKVEQAALLDSNGGKEQRLAVCALGRSVATPKEGVTAEVVEVHSLEEARNLGQGGNGKIVFYNRRFDPTLLNTFEAYGGAVDQRYAGASAAASSGAVAVLVRSMTLATDDEPHTGAMQYEKGLPKIPAAALSAKAADTLSARLKLGAARVRLKLDCKTLPDVDSANVVGELTGSEKPNEVIVIGAHLDSWDKGVGAHDDGAGCAHAIEALSLLKRTGLRPKRTIRVVLFMNEENGAAGGLAYGAAKRPIGERHIAAIESDSGGFIPRGFGVNGNPETLDKLRVWLPVLEPFGVTKLHKEDSEPDLAPLGKQGVPTIDIQTESQRYFDYHHSNNDTLDKVNPRELELGAITMALLAYMISEEGL